jgi:exodeoxyribonuclease VII large subunit
MSVPAVLTVSQLTARIKRLLEEHPPFSQLVIRGEVSNVTAHTSGHLYFTLKDANAQIQAVMFRQHVQQARYPHPKAGDQVQVTGALNVYPQRGAYQLLVYELEAAGQGHLFEQFLQLKHKLESVGLFDATRKRSLPRFPRCIGVITSPTGAVIQDIINTIRRRYPALKLLILPAAVQGIEALPSLLEAFQQVDKLPQIEAVILARGGGSLEDLWAFNEEALAVAIAACPRPVISAIGHETDFTIADFVADLRAPTPTAAAELVTRDRADLHDELQHVGRTLAGLLSSRLINEQQRLDELAEGAARSLLQTIRSEKHELESLAHQLTLYAGLRRQTAKLEVDSLAKQLAHEVMLALSRERERISLVASELQVYDVAANLQAGYSLTFVDGLRLNAQSPEELAGRELTTHYAKGQITSRVIDSQEPREPLPE